MELALEIAKVLIAAGIGGGALRLLQMWMKHVRSKQSWVDDQYELFEKRNMEREQRLEEKILRLEKLLEREREKRLQVLTEHLSKHIRRKRGDGNADEQDP